MDTKQVRNRNLGLARHVRPGCGMAICGRGARTVVRAWRDGDRMVLTISAPDDLAICPAERLEEEMGVVAGELRGGVIEPAARGPRPADEESTAALFARITDNIRQADDLMHSLRQEIVVLRLENGELRRRLLKPLVEAVS